MESTGQLMNALILGVSHLCERTRELALSRSHDPRAVEPVREATGMVSTTLEALCRAFEEEEALRGALPAEEPEEIVVDDSWDAGFPDTIFEGDEG